MPWPPAWRRDRRPNRGEARSPGMPPPGARSRRRAPPLPADRDLKREARLSRRALACRFGSSARCAEARPRAARGGELSAPAPERAMDVAEAAAELAQCIGDPDR